MPVLPRFSNRLLSAGFGLFLTSAAPAQIRLAAIGGLHTADLKETNDLPSWNQNTGPFYTGNSGFMLGLLSEIPIGKGFFFQPGIDYAAKGRTFQKFYDSSSLSSDTAYYKAETKLSYVEIPLFVTRKFSLSKKGNTSFYVGAGPYLAFIYAVTANTEQRIFNPITGKEEFSSDKSDLEVGKAPDKYRTLDAGFGIRAGFELSRVMIGGYFTQGLKNAYQASYPGKFRNSTVGVSLGIWLSPPEVLKKEPPVQIPVMPVAKKHPHYPDPVNLYQPPQVNPGSPTYRAPELSAGRIERHYQAKNIAFESSSTKLTTGSGEAIATLADSLNANPDWSLMIEGFTDVSGDPEKNILLSKARAETVKKALTGRGVAPARIRTAGFGDASPLEDNSTPEGRAANRRVVFRLFKK